MFTAALKQIKIALILLGVLSISTGLIYPVLVTGIAQLLFPWKANGSLIEYQGKTIGSALMGQSFESPAYFSGRPSATSPTPYNTANSSGSNSGPSNEDFLKTVQGRVDHIHKENPKNKKTIPADLVTASGSGLDPDISPEAALYQSGRIAQLRDLPENEIVFLIERMVKPRTFGILGEPRVNVLELNIALDNLGSRHD